MKKKFYKYPSCKGIYLHQRLCSKKHSVFSDIQNIQKCTLDRYSKMYIEEEIANFKIQNGTV